MDFPDLEFKEPLSLETLNNMTEEEKARVERDIVKLFEYYSHKPAPMSDTDTIGSMEELLASFTNLDKSPHNAIDDLL